MKLTILIPSLTLILTGIISAGDSFREDLKKNESKPLEPKLKMEDIEKKHSTGSIKTANEQDELSADVQDLIQEQTDPKVLELLNEAEILMTEAAERLENKLTGGNTIAIKTEIIEKIYEAAKQKQQSKAEGQGQPQPGRNSMLEMMKGMMGEGQGEGEGQGDDNTKEERRVPKNTTAPNQNLPREEQRALDAYNKSVKK